MQKNTKSASPAVRKRVLRQAMSPQGAAPVRAERPGSTRSPRATSSTRKSVLHWYADRGALVEADEEPGLNERRLYAGEALARLHDQAYRRARVTARYSAAQPGGSGSADDTFVRSESARRAFEEKFVALPHRTRAVIRLCVIDDEFVGRSRMERLRCGLDKLVELDLQRKQSQNVTKSVDRCTIV